MRLALALVVLVALGCGPSPATDADAGVDGGLEADAPFDAPAPLSADAGPPIFALVGEEIVLDASASTGAVSYEWWPGDGRRLPPGPSPIATATFDAPGRYRADLIAYDASGARRTDTTTITVTRAPVVEPRQTSTIALAATVDPIDRRAYVAVARPEHDAIFLLARDLEAGTGLAPATSVPVCDHPRTLAGFDLRRIAVACDGDDSLFLHDLLGSIAPARVRFRYGARPYGVLSLGEARVAVSLAGTGEVAVVEDSGSGPAITATWPAIEDARAMALLPDGRIVVSRWRSPDGGGELVVLDLETGARAPITLAVDPQVASDTEVGGVPTYLGSIAVSPDGSLLAVAGLQASLEEGGYRSGRPLRFDTAIRATISFVDVATLSEIVERRRQLDNRGLASALTFSPRGDFLYVAMRGNRSLERYDVLRDVMAGTVQDLGFALDGLVSLPSGVVYLDASLSRAVVELDAAGLGDVVETSRAIWAGPEPLAPEVLRGAQLFSDSADARIGRDGYMACAHCHLDGLDDHRTWDFSDRGEGLRSTIELAGRAGEAPIHWSANFDEIQDFENDLRNAFLGTGLLSDSDWAGHMATLGPSKAGLSEDLDALEAYVATLDDFLRSPHRDPDGSLPAAAIRGRAIFERADVGCTDCHAAPRFTDSAFVSPGVPLLHDVGTLGPGSGMRLGGPLTGLDTPTLRGVFGTAPYLHDGSAATLRDVVTTRNAADLHGTTSGLSSTEIDDLVAYLECLDGTID